MKAHEQAFLKEKQLLARVYAFSFINNSGHRFTVFSFLNKYNLIKDRLRIIIFY